MNTLVVYDSKYGNTARLAQAIAEKLGVARVVSVAETGALDLSAFDLFVVGGPTQVHRMSPAMKEWLASIPPDALQGARAAAFDTRFRKAELLTGSAAVGIARKLEKKGAALALPPESFFVATDKGPLEDGELERAIAWAAAIRREASAALEPEPTP
jgi:flavodoxin